MKKSLIKVSPFIHQGLEALGFESFGTIEASFLMHDKYVHTLSRLELQLYSDDTIGFVATSPNMEKMPQLMADLASLLERNKAWRDFDELSNEALVTKLQQLVYEELELYNGNSQDDADKAMLAGTEKYRERVTAEVLRRMNAS